MNLPERVNTGLNGRITRPLLKHISLVKMKRFSTGALKLRLVKRRPVNAEDAIALLEEEKQPVMMAVLCSAILPVYFFGVSS
jgi:hypothetical protein